MKKIMMNSYYKEDVKLEVKPKSKAKQRLADFLGERKSQSSWFFKRNDNV